jgi:hypothetical protein
MNPLSEIGTTSVLMIIQVCCLLIMLISAFCFKKVGSMLAERFKDNMQSFTLWGSFINLILITYLPVCVAMFISTVGLQWEETNTAVLLNNVWTIFMLHAWLLFPIFLFISFYKNRAHIGKKDPMAEVKSKLENIDKSNQKD